MEKAFDSETYNTARDIIKEKKSVVLTVKPQYDTYTQDAIVTNLNELKTIFKYCDRMKYDIIKVY